ncbi:hypothetical protein B7486_10200 [cyanobacterium TDX16]|nr:hypothetical protein B7486_10200 [cyanobacterium TDX16]
MIATPDTHAQASASKTPVRLWQTIAFRTGVLVNLVVVAVLGTAALVDARRERESLLRQEVERLREEANVLAVARAQLDDEIAFQRFLNDFCRQMSGTASPGHHIAFLNDAGATVLRAHQHANADLERQMAIGLKEQKELFSHEGQDYLVVGVSGRPGSMIAIAQSIKPLERVLRNQWRSRVYSLATLILLVSGLTGTGLFVWVRRPLRSLVKHIHAVARGRFDVRALVSGTAEVRFLATGLNEMTRSLEQVDQVRKQEMQRARRIQEGLLPPREQQITGYSVAAVFIPTESVGGDLYDVIPLADGSILVAVMDVAGHGVPAALYTALLRTVLHYETKGPTSLAAIMTRLNEEVRRVSRSQDFVTCLLARLWAGEGRLEYVRAGHEPAIVVHQDGEVTELEDGGIVLGIESQPEFEASEAAFAAQDRLFVFTDGLNEAVSPGGKMLGRAELIRMIAARHTMPLIDQLGTVVELVQAFQGGKQFLDDVTLVGVGTASERARE